MDAPVPEKTRWRWSGLLIVAAVFIIAVVLSWRKWLDPLIDFGVQLYLPWRLSTGAVLYHGVTYLTGGPLSQYYHALLFKIFGVSFLALIVSNLLVTAGMILLIYRWFHSASDMLTATVICVGMILVFAFGQLIEMGNYTYAAPYSHEALHGLALSIATIGLLARWLKSEQIGVLAAASFCFGLVFLTKPEIFAALAICTAAAFVIFHSRRMKINLSLKFLMVFLLTALVPLLICFFLFLRVENWRASLQSVAGAWQPLFATSVANNSFYQWCLGLDSPWLNLFKIAIHFFVVCGVIGFYAVAFRWMKLSNVSRVFPIAFIALLLAAASAFDWTDCGRALPLLTLALLALLCRDFKRGGDGEKIIFPLLWSVFSLALLAKLGLFPRIWHYGFVLAMPAFAGAIYFLLWLLPRRLENHGVPSRWLRVTVGLVFLTGFAQLFVQSQLRFEEKNVVLGAGGDKMFAFSPTVSVAPQVLGEAISWIETNTPPSATLAVLPEGAMVNYLARRANPTPFIVWTPFDSAIFGETNLISAFAKNSPDYFVLVYRNMDEFRAGYFGEDPNYGAPFMQWIGRNYAPVFSAVRDEPRQDRKFGVKIFKRLSPSAAISGAKQN